MNKEEKKAVQQPPNYNGELIAKLSEFIEAEGVRITNEGGNASNYFVFLDHLTELKKGQL